MGSHHPHGNPGEPPYHLDSCSLLQRTSEKRVTETFNELLSKRKCLFTQESYNISKFNLKLPLTSCRDFAFCSLSILVPPQHSAHHREVPFRSTNRLEVDQCELHEGQQGQVQDPAAGSGQPQPQIQAGGGWIDSSLRRT